MAASALEKKAFEPGEVILHEGQPVQAAGMVKSGTVRVYTETDGKEVPLAELGEGQIFGEMGLLTGQKAVATVEAVGPTTVVYISREQLKAVFLKSPKPIQRIMWHLIDRLRYANTMLVNNAPEEESVQESEPTLTKVRYVQRTENRFLGVCQVLSLLTQGGVGGKTQVGKAKPGAKGGPAAEADGVSIKDVIKTVKNIYPMSQTEVEDVLGKLAKMGVIRFSDQREVTYTKNIFGERQKSGAFVTDRTIYINEPATFLKVAKNMYSEFMGGGGEEPSEMEFIDLPECAEMLQTNAEMLYKKIGNLEIPESLFFLPKGEVGEWAQKVGEDFFKKTKKKRLNLDELENVDDLVFVDNSTLGEAFKRLDFRKMAILFSSAGDDAKEKMSANFSKKIAKIVQEEATDMEVDEMELGDIETELFDLVRKIKKGG
jgi:CRP-like cAMP-binding protein